MSKRKRKHRPPCVKCGQRGNRKNPITRHHVLPQRYYDGAGQVVYLCRRCHDKLELMIPFRKQSISFYFKVVKDFLK